MGQMRCALMLGVRFNGDHLPDEYWEHASRYNGDPEFTENGVLGFPFAESEEGDDSGIYFPSELDTIEKDYEDAIRAAREKWEAFRTRMHTLYQAQIPEGRLYLDEVERS